MALRCHHIDLDDVMFSEVYEQMLHADRVLSTPPSRDVEAHLYRFVEVVLLSWVAKNDHLLTTHSRWYARTQRDVQARIAV